MDRNNLGVQRQADGRWVAWNPTSSELIVLTERDMVMMDVAYIIGQGDARRSTKGGT